MIVFTLNFAFTCLNFLNSGNHQGTTHWTTDQKIIKSSHYNIVSSPFQTLNTDSGEFF
jgi:hypothetical protein